MFLYLLICRLLKCCALIQAITIVYIINRKLFLQTICQIFLNCSIIHFSECFHVQVRLLL